MTGYFLALLLSAAPSSAEDAIAPAEAAASTATVVVSTAALSGPELKRLRNSEIAALKKKQAAETAALTRSMKDAPRGEARRAMKELKVSHEKELAALKARHDGEKTVPAPESGSAEGEDGEAGKKAPSRGKGL